MSCWIFKYSVNSKTFYHCKDSSPLILPLSIFNGLFFHSPNLLWTIFRRFFFFFFTPEMKQCVSESRNYSQNEGIVASQIRFWSPHCIQAGKIISEFSFSSIFFFLLYLGLWVKFYSEARSNFSTVLSKQSVWCNTIINTFKLNYRNCLNLSILIPRLSLWKTLQVQQW